MGFIHFDAEDEGMYDDIKPLTQEQIKNGKKLIKEMQECMKIVIGPILSELVKDGYIKTR